MELLRALAVLAEPPRPEHRPLREALGIADEPEPAAHTDLFAFQLYPYASVFLNADGMLGGDARDRVAGFWRALRVTPAAEPDHLCALLALYASLREREHGEADDGRRLMWTRAAWALLWEHVAPWAFAFAAKAIEIASPFYRAWAMLLRDALAAELAGDFCAEPLPAALRALPRPPEPDGDGVDVSLSALLAPARSGLVLVRSDLRRAARDLGLGLRHGERRYVLRALFDQDAAATLEWLACEAATWERRHGAMLDVPYAIRSFWGERARMTAELQRCAGSAPA
jgi:hypothetical protein